LAVVVSAYGALSSGAIPFTNEMNAKARTPTSAAHTSPAQKNVTGRFRPVSTCLAEP